MRKRTSAYEIERLGPNRCRLHLTSNHRLSTRFNAYAAWWSEKIMAQIQGSILEVIRIRAEAKYNAQRCSGQAIDFVGCHHAEIAHCRITGKPGFSQHTGPQFKGGSSDVWIHHCRLENAGMRPIQAGGSTGLEYFRPQRAPYEATRIRIEDNVIVGGECAVAFTGATACDFRFNAIEGPEKWVFRILQEQRDAHFARCGNNRLTNNIVVFKSSKVRTILNIGPDTEPKTFEFRGNHWFASDAPDRSRPELPVAETAGVYGVDPDLDPASLMPRHKLPAGPR